jgi:hypothetical protein
VSQTSHEPPRTSPAAGDERGRPLPAPSPVWQGWTYFGATVMGLMGIFWLGLGLVALLDEEFFRVRTNQLLAVDTYAAWGWVHVLGGLLAIGTGVALLGKGRAWARRAGIVVAGLCAVVNLGFLVASPVWSTIMIGFSLFIVYTLTVHGWEIEEP